jgi:hypothetical protein
MAERTPGEVFYYPYLWSQDHARGLDNPKARTSCLVFETRDKVGATHLVILAIRDQAPKHERDAVHVPEIERRRGGLDVAREAYVHVGEYNDDVLPFSTSYEPSAPSLGRVSRSFTEHVARALAANIRAGRARRFSRA